MKYAVLIERGPTSFGATVPDLPGCVAVGATREAVAALIEEVKNTSPCSVLAACRSLLLRRMCFKSTSADLEGSGSRLGCRCSLEDVRLGPRRGHAAEAAVCD
jgi:hypothetical protein